MKYLIIKRPRHTQADCILFANPLSHRELANILGLGKCEVLGAGICGFDWNPDEGEWEVYLLNGSESLGIDKKHEDEAYIKYALNEGNR